MAAKVWTAGQGALDPLASLIASTKPLHLGSIAKEALGRVDIILQGGDAYPILLIHCESAQYPEWFAFIKKVKSAIPSCFVICASVDALAPVCRLGLTDVGVAMISNDASCISEAINLVSTQRRGPFSCVHCRLRLDEDSLWRHTPLYHTNVRNVGFLSCPICSKTCSPESEPYPVHLRNAHGPCGRGEEVSEYDHRDESIYAFSLIVCLRTHQGKRQILLVQEFASSGFWLPGGRVDPGERLERAALRECKEEAGCDVKLTGVLQLQYSPSKRGHVRLRVLFLAEPLDVMQNLKSLPDYESMGALWVNLDEVEELHDRGMLRGDEPHVWTQHLLNNGTVHSLSVLGSEIR